jgi:glycosyltransferase involved in cell wall biosynthesis
LEESVTFTGVLPKEEWHTLSENYDIFINTTTIDNTPVSVMEAMALGLPIISSKVGGIPYLLNDQIDSLLVENNSINQMVDSVVYLLNNQDFTEKIAENARLKVESFDWSVVRDKWLQIIS